MHSHQLYSAMVVALRSLDKLLFSVIDTLEMGNYVVRWPSDDSDAI